MSKKSETNYPPAIEWVRKQYINAVNNYMYLWVSKHGYEYEEDMWVRDNYGSIYMCGDMFVSFDDIRYDVDNELEENIFEEWYWYSLEIAEFGSEIHLTLEMYANGDRPYTEEQIEELREAHKTVVEAQNRLDELIKHSQKEITDGKISD